MNLFTPVPADSVAALGERRLLAEIRRWLGRVSPRAPFGVGDDCAVVPSTGRPLLLTMDPVILGRHFDERVPARAVGAKLLKRNLSDIAAMGGRPRSAVVGLTLAADTRLAWLHAFYLGLAATARRHGVRIVGGDLAQGPAGHFGATLMLHGEAAGPRYVTRTGARRGDGLWVTGTLGGSLLGHHHRFTPRLAEGAWLARRPEVRAMMDVSDGLATDLERLTPPGLQPVVWTECVPVSAAARRQAGATGRTPLFHALSDGEDYELLCVLDGRADPRALQRAWRRRFPRLALTEVGVFARRGRRLSGAGPLAGLHGYEHLQLPTSDRP